MRDEKAQSMIKKSIFAAALMFGFCLAVPAMAQGTPAERPTAPVVKQSWTFGGIFGTYDERQLQRGFQVFREICSGCHAARLLAFRNLAEEGGPHFTAGQVKELAAQYDIVDSTAVGGTRKAVPADHWPQQLSDADAISNFGLVPPDMSVLAKARAAKPAFPDWIFNYFTAYQEAGPDYIHALLLGYAETPPDGVTLPDGKFYNEVFPVPGHSIGMPPPLADGTVSYTGEDGKPVPATLDQAARDVSAFLMWVADPHMAARKETGFKVILFLFLFAGLMWFVKQRLWKGIEH
jgi:ubiquinol-cytochrome c reductase cytochrome c1 subunit